jgi:methionyl-tRNA formyltransferase
MKVVFFGTPSFAAHVLEYLIEQKVSIAAVVSKPDKPKGRSGAPVPTPVKEVALKHHLPLYQPELASSPEFAETLKSYQADLFVVVAYGEIVKQHLLDMPRLACINLHASLLPAYRGAAPIHRAIINGEKESGVTIMHMVKKMDAGNMIERAAVPIGENTTFEELQEALCAVGKKLLLKVIKDFEKGPLPGTPQEHEKATFAPRIELEDCELHFEQPAAILHNLIRGANPAPGAWCQVVAKGQQKRLKVYASRVQKLKGKPKEILSAKELIVACGEDALQLLEVQLEGKKRMKAEELLRGNPDLKIY